MKITVTAGDIETGEPTDCEKCPVALTISRAFPGQHVEVYDQLIHIGHMARLTPNEVRDFILNFDDDESVEPFEFELPDRPINDPSEPT